MFRFIVAFILCKTSIIGLRMLGRRASHTPGRIALHFCPDYIKYLSKPGHIICVTGTNGKSTVCNLLEDSLRNSGYRVLDNKFGSNTANGIASALTKGVTVFNKTKFDDCVLEVDERSSPRIYKYVHPDYLVVVDLFRDSIKRNAHPDFISDVISTSVPDDTTLVLNSDDIIGSRVRCDGNNQRVYFSVQQLPGEVIDQPNIINDASYCPACGGRTDFSFRRYHHIGRMKCRDCGLENPLPDYTVTGFDAAKKELYVTEAAGQFIYPLIQTSAFNVYNEISAISLLRQLQLTPQQIAASLQSVKVTDSRYYENRVGDVHFISHVMKGQNPIAASVVSNYVSQLPGGKTIFMMLDDILEIKDSTENITWYYEADFERLHTEEIRHIYISGYRAEDMKYRLLLAGIPAERMTTFLDYHDITALADFTLSPTFIMIFELYYYDDQLLIRKAIEDKLAAMGGAQV